MVEELHERAKPMARHADDDDLNAVCFEKINKNRGTVNPHSPSFCSTYSTPDVESENPR